MKVSRTLFTLLSIMPFLAYGMDESNASTATPTPATLAPKPFDPKNKTSHEICRETLRRIAQAQFETRNGAKK